MRRALLPCTLAALAACTAAAPAVTDAGVDVPAVPDVPTVPDVPGVPDVSLPRDSGARDVPPSNPRCPGGAAMPYPEVTEIADGAPVPPFTFGAGEGALSLRDRYTPCAATPDLLVLRVMAAWSGHARWNAARTGNLRRGALGARVLGGLSAFCGS